MQENLAWSILNASLSLSTNSFYSVFVCAVRMCKHFRAIEMYNLGERFMCMCIVQANVKLSIVAIRLVLRIDTRIFGISYHLLFILYKIILLFEILDYYEYEFNKLSEKTKWIAHAYWMQSQYAKDNHKERCMASSGMCYSTHYSMTALWSHTGWARRLSIADTTHTGSYTSLDLPVSICLPLLWPHLCYLGCCCPDMESSFGYWSVTCYTIIYNFDLMTHTVAIYELLEGYLMKFFSNLFALSVLKKPVDL